MVMRGRCDAELWHVGVPWLSLADALVCFGGRGSFFVSRTGAASSWGTVVALGARARTGRAAWSRRLLEGGAGESANGVIVRGSAALGPRVTSIPARRSPPTAGTRGGAPGIGGSARPDAIEAGGCPASSGGAGMIFNYQAATHVPIILLRRSAARARYRRNSLAFPSLSCGWRQSDAPLKRDNSPRGDGIPRRRAIS